MDNRWANNDGEEIVIEKEKNNEESSTSRKMGIAMGVVGILLVAAGVVPMFMNSADLQGDVTTAAQEEIDPLVALLSGGTPIPSVSPAASASSSAEAVDPLVALLSGGTPLPSAAPSVAPSNPSVPTPMPTVAKTPTPLTMAPTATAVMPTPVATAAFAPTAIAVNANVGKTDTAGAAFHDAAALENSSKTPTVANTATKPVASHTPAKNVSAGPESMPKTGADTTFLMLGFAFLFSAILYRRKNLS